MYRLSVCVCVAGGVVQYCVPDVCYVYASVCMCRCVHQHLHC